MRDDRVQGLFFRIFFDPFDPLVRLSSRRLTLPAVEGPRRLVEIDMFHNRTERQGAWVGSDRMTGAPAVGLTIREIPQLGSGKALRPADVDYKLFVIRALCREWRDVVGEFKPLTFDPSWARGEEVIHFSENLLQRVHPLHVKEGEKGT